MEIILDACTIINLINGEVLQEISLISNHTIYICDNILEEEILDSAQKLFIEALIIKGHVKLLESDVTLAEFTSLSSRYNLGFGELECLALCKKHFFHIATDDANARKFAKAELGTEKVIGSLYLIRDAVRNLALNEQEAKNAFKMMKIKGGFLPNIEDSYFTS
jgi:predicted nucleic acid-binding protein